MDPYIVFHGQPCSQGQEAGRKDPSLEELLQKQLHCRLMQPRPPAGSTQLFALIWYFLNLFAFFFFPLFLCFKGTQARNLDLPCQTQCRGPSWGRVSAFPWRWAQRSCPQGQEVLGSFHCASLAGSALLSSSFPPLTFLSAAVNSSGLISHWWDRRGSVPPAKALSGRSSPVTNAFYSRQQQPPPPQAELEVVPGRESLSGYEQVNRGFGCAVSSSPPFSGRGSGREGGSAPPGCAAERPGCSAAPPAPLSASALQVPVQPAAAGPEHSKPLEKAESLFNQERDPRFGEIYSGINAGARCCGFASPGFGSAPVGFGPGVCGLSGRSSPGGFKAC